MNGSLILLRNSFQQLLWSWQRTNWRDLCQARLAFYLYVGIRRVIGGDDNNLALSENEYRKVSLCLWIHFGRSVGTWWKYLNRQHSKRNRWSQKLEYVLSYLFLIRSVWRVQTVAPKHGLLISDSFFRFFRQVIWLCQAMSWLDGFQPRLDLWATWVRIFFCLDPFYGPHFSDIYCISH